MHDALTEFSLFIFNVNFFSNLYMQMKQAVFLML